MNLSEVLSESLEAGEADCGLARGGWAVEILELKREWIWNSVFKALNLQHTKKVEI